MLMHDGLVLGLTPQDFIFRVVTFLVVFFIAFLIEHFAVKLSRKALDSSIAACFWYSANSICNSPGSYVYCPVFWPSGHYFQFGGRLGPYAGRRG